MTYRLVEDPDAVAALADAVSDQTGIPPPHIEKDFWVTEVLRGVATTATAIGVEVVFKGGTSLSKAFSLIERFSEDVDVLVILPETSVGARDRILKTLVTGASQASNLNPEPVAAATSKGVRRGARFRYRTDDSPSAGLSQGVFLELGSRGGAMPATVLPVRSLLAQHATAELTDAVEAEPVDVRVQAPSRTLVEKLILLHTAHSEADPASAIKGARHFYDVHQLLGRNEIVADIADIGIAVLARDICTYSAAAHMPYVPRPHDGFGDSAAFNNGPHVEAARAEYESRVLGQLLWPDATRPSLDECIAAVHWHRDQL